MSKGSKSLGRKLKAMRKRTGMTQPQLAGASGVATSIVNDLENGIRPAGSKTINRIAKGLELDEEERFLLVLEGLKTSKRDFLIPDFSDYPPEILNFLPYALQRTGIKAGDVSKISLPGKKSRKMKIELNSGREFSLEIRLSPH